MNVHAPDLLSAGRLAPWPFPGLAVRAYGLIMADPAWTFTLRSAKGGKKSPQAQYGCMSLDEIAALPVADLAAEDCVLWLWATAPLLDQQIELAARWGFTFKTSGVWVKTTVHGKVTFGTGYILRNAHEPFLICTRGRPKVSRAVRSVVMGERREHSRKPETAYAAAERLVPGVRRADLFARQVRPGWDGWGDQLERFAA
jgi:N6-adenosine-specific RNA methylase IME4